MLEDFYTLDTLVQDDAAHYHCTLTLNAQHPIYKGHFPGNPVTPGVCMLQIIKNLAEQITGQQLFLAKTTNVKFMALINPYTHPHLQLSLQLATQADELVVKAVTTFVDTVALKVTNTYKIVS